MRHYFYDANGNVGQLVDPEDGAVTARYEYDPFGNAVSVDGVDAAGNVFRFSTKFYDQEVKLYYYGYRYYSAELGRWINRDPIGEEGGINLYQVVSNNIVGRIDYLGRNEVVISGGCNPNFHGWDIPGGKYGLELPYRILRKIGVPIAHDRNWSNFILAAENEIVKRKRKLNEGEHIEWHVDAKSYTRRSEEDGQGENAYLDEIKKLAKKHNVILRWFSEKGEFAVNINTGPQGERRHGQEKISRFTYFGHGAPGELMLQYNNRFGNNPGAAALSMEDIKNGILEKAAFTQNAIGISCGCNTATPTENNKSFRDAWKAYFGFELYGVMGKTEYYDPSDVKPEAGGEWIPSNPPE